MIDAQHPQPFGLEEINKTRFLKAAELYDHNETFVIVGYDAIKKDTNIDGRSAVVSEFRVKLLSDQTGSIQILSLGYNSRHENMRDYFDQNPNGSTVLLALGKQAASKKGYSDAWVFVDGLEVEKK